MAKVTSSSSKKVARKVKNKVTNKAYSELDGFVDFIRKQGVVGLAIGFIMGTQAKQLIDQLTKSFVDPIIGLIIGGGQSLSQKTLYLQVGSRSATFTWGAFMSAIINFIIISAVIYFTFKWLRLDKLDQKKK